MKFTKKEKNDYLFSTLCYIAFVVVSAFMICFGVYKNDLSTVAAGMLVFGISLLIPILSTAALVMTAMRGSRKKILRAIKKKHSDKSITNESK